MHELSIATAVVEQAERTSRAYGGAAVTAVRVRVGELSGVVPDALRFSFDVARADTAAAGALLVVDEVPARARCEPCGDVFAVGTPPMLWCPRCDTPAAELAGGRELEITAVELEGELEGDQEGDEEPARAEPVPAGATAVRDGAAPRGAGASGTGPHGTGPHGAEPDSARPLSAGPDSAGPHEGAA